MSFRVPEMILLQNSKIPNPASAAFLMKLFLGDTVMFIGFYSNFYVTVPGVADCKQRLHHTAPTGGPVPGVLS